MTHTWKLLVISVLAFTSSSTIQGENIEYSQPLANIVPGLEQDLERLQDNILAVTYLDLESIVTTHFFKSKFVWPTNDTNDPALKSLLHLKAFEIIIDNTSHNPATAASAYALGLLNSNNSVFKKNLTCTYLGQAALAHTLANPLPEAKQIVKRQEAIQALLDRPSLRRELTDMLKDVHAVEPLMYKHFTEYKDERAGFHNPPWANEIIARGLQVCGCAVPFAYWWLTKNYWIERPRVRNERDANGLLATGFFFSLLGPVASCVSLSTYKDKQEFLIIFARILRGVEKVAQAFSRSSALLQGIPYAQAIMSYLQHPGTVLELRKLLTSSTFSGSASYFSRVGRVETAYNMYLESKAETMQLLQAIGMLDAFLAMTKHMKDAETTPLPYCFVQVVDSSKTQLSITQAWSPQQQIFTSEDQSKVPNISVAITPPAGHLLIAGPRRSGKTTTIVAIGQCVLMAQAFGIAPAKQMSISPFHAMIKPTEKSTTELMTSIEQNYNSKEKLIFIMDTDAQLWPPNEISRLIKMLNRHPQITAVITSGNTDLHALPRETGTVSCYTLESSDDQKASSDFLYHVKVVPS
jgi:hypothetical protein